LMSCLKALSKTIDMQIKNYYIKTISLLSGLSEASLSAEIKKV
jgi:hypothetical protein